MECPFCHTSDTSVKETRPQDDKLIKRRRLCINCGRNFYTIETPILKLPRVIKNDNRIEAFDINKIDKSFNRALEKRPIATDALEKAVTQVKNQVLDLNEGEITSKVIGQLVLKELKDLDPVAFIRFASVYRDYKELKEFILEIENLNLL